MSEIVEKYLILVASFGFIIGLCKVLSFGQLVRLVILKKLFRNASLKEIESFEKNTIPKYYLYKISCQDSETSSE